MTRDWMGGSVVDNDRAERDTIREDTSRLDSPLFHDCPLGCRASCCWDPADGAA